MGALCQNIAKVSFVGCARQAAAGKPQSHGYATEYSTTDENDCDNDCQEMTMEEAREEVRGSDRKRQVSVRVFDSDDRRDGSVRNEGSTWI